MNLTLRKFVKVQSGRRIEILAPELTEGATAEVIVLVDVAGTERPTQPAALATLIGAAQGGFDTPAAADDFLSRERNAWAE